MIWKKLSILKVKEETYDRNWDSYDDMEPDERPQSQTDAKYKSHEQEHWNRSRK